jgi:hypothetical protein
MTKDGEFDQARLWQTLGGIQADLSTIKSNQSTLFCKVDDLVRKGCAVGEEHSKDLARQGDRITYLEQIASNEAATAIPGQPLRLTHQRKSLLIAASVGGGGAGIILLIQAILDFLLKIHG